MPRSDPNQLLRLYKYRSLAGEHGRNAAEDILRHHRLFWQSPVAFNDPFDCNPVFVFGTCEADRLRFAKRAVGRLFPHLSRKDRTAKIRELLRVSPPKRAAEMKDGFNQWMRETAVTCFSEVHDCPLMWAHYADSHRGVCFIFQEIMEPEPWFALDVEYSEERPVIDYTADPRKVIEEGLLTKSLHWRYEKEHRMIGYRRGPGYRAFPLQALVGVIYGARVTHDDRTFIQQLIGQTDVELYQARIDPRFFRVNIEPTN